MIWRLVTFWFRTAIFCLRKGTRLYFFCILHIGMKSKRSSEVCFGPYGQEKSWIGCYFFPSCHCCENFYHLCVSVGFKKHSDLDHACSLSTLMCCHHTYHRLLEILDINRRSTTTAMLTPSSWLQNEPFFFFFYTNAGRNLHLSLKSYLCVVIFSVLPRAAHIVPASFCCLPKIKANAVFCCDGALVNARRINLKAGAAWIIPVLILV